MPPINTPINTPIVPLNRDKKANETAADRSKYLDDALDQLKAQDASAEAEASNQTSPTTLSQARAKLSILVVDGARFSSTIIAKILRTGGFKDVRFTNSPFQALRSLEKRPAGIIIADWNLPAMNGLELTRRVRASEPSTRHHTHIILLTGTEETADLEEALAIGVDDFLGKEQIRSLLKNRILAAQKLSARQNSLLRENAALTQQVSDLRTTDVIDPITGLGNLKFTLERINDLTKETEARGGATCLLLVGISNLAVIREQYDPETMDELITGFAAKVRALVRPLDVVTRPEPGILAVSMRQPSLEDCSTHSFKRVFDNLYMHSFKTSEGYIPVVIGVSICAADDSTGLPDAKSYLRAGYDALTRSYDTGVITLTNYSSDQANRHLALWA